MKKNLNAARLKERREAIGLTKLEASKRMQLTQSGYVRYESGERNPAYPILMVMANVLQTSVSYLVGETSDPSPDFFLIDRYTEPELFQLVEHISELEASQKQQLNTIIAQLHDQGSASEESR